jgi:hypothetical protein
MKVDYQLVKIEIWKTMAFHLVYNKLNTKNSKTLVS